MSQCLDHSLSIDTTTSASSADCTPVPSIDTATAPIMDQTLLDAKSTSYDTEGDQLLSIAEQHDMSIDESDPDTSPEKAKDKSVDDKDEVFVAATTPSIAIPRPFEVHIYFV